MDLAKNGVIVHTAETSDEAMKLLSNNSYWGTHVKNFRIVIIEEDVRPDIIAIVCLFRPQISTDSLLSATK